MKSNDILPPGPRDILDELKSLIGEAETMMAGSLSERSSEALANLRERFDEARRHFSDYYDRARIRVVKGAQCTDTSIREHPYQSLAIALGVGALLGALLARRHN